MGLKDKINDIIIIGGIVGALSGIAFSAYNIHSLMKLQNTPAYAEVERRRKAIEEDEQIGWIY